MIVLMLNINLILSDNRLKIDDQIIENLEHQVYKDEENEIFNLSEEHSVQEYIQNMTISTVSNGTFNDDGKFFFDAIREIIIGIVDRFRNPK